MTMDGDNDGWPDILDSDCFLHLGFEQNRYPVECNDGVDNDGDANIDHNDSGCFDSTDTNEADPSAECSDGIDNDGDGWTDIEDPECITDVGNLDCVSECNEVWTTMEMEMSMRQTLTAWSHWITTKAKPLICLASTVSTMMEMDGKMT